MFAHRRWAYVCAETIPSPSPSPFPHATSASVTTEAPTVRAAFLTTKLLSARARARRIPATSFVRPRGASPGGALVRRSPDASRTDVSLAPDRVPAWPDHVRSTRAAARAPIPVRRSCRRGAGSRRGAAAACAGGWGRASVYPSPARTAGRAPPRSTPHRRERARTPRRASPGPRGAISPLSLSARCPSRTVRGSRSRASPCGWRRRSGDRPRPCGPLHVEEATHPDEPRDDRDEDAREQEPWNDCEDVAVHDPRHELHAVVQWVDERDLQGEQHEDGGDGSDETLEQPFDEERDADAPVGGAHELHDADLLAASEQTHPHRVRDQHRGRYEHHDGDEQHADAEHARHGEQPVQELALVDERLHAGGGADVPAPARFTPEDRRNLLESLRLRQLHPKRCRQRLGIDVFDELACVGKEILEPLVRLLLVLVVDGRDD